MWPENAAAWDAFYALDTAWQITSGLGGAAYLGLPRSEILATLELQGIKKKRRAELFEQLREMEKAALVVLNGTEEKTSGAGAQTDEGQP